MKSSFTIIYLLVFLGAASCDRDDTTRSPAPPPPASSDHQLPTTAPSALPRVIFLGDSITAGLGLDADQAYPSLLSKLLRDENFPIEPINAGVSGDTTAGALRRLDWLLRQKPDVIVVALGANDGLRAIDLKSSEANLRNIILKSKAAGAHVLLAGMLIPPNYGPEHTTQFRRLYPTLATERDVPLLPFLHEGVGGNPHLNQPDGIHPTLEGQRIIANNVLPYLRDILQQRSRQSSLPAPQSTAPTPPKPSPAPPQP